MQKLSIHGTRPEHPVHIPGQGMLNLNQVIWGPVPVHLTSPSRITVLYHHLEDCSGYRNIMYYPPFESFVAVTLRQDTALFRPGIKSERFRPSKSHVTTWQWNHPLRCFVVVPHFGFVPTFRGKAQPVMTCDTNVFLASEKPRKSEKRAANLHEFSLYQIYQMEFVKWVKSLRFEFTILIYHVSSIYCNRCLLWCYYHINEDAKSIVKLSSIIEEVAIFSQSSLNLRIPNLPETKPLSRCLWSWSKQTQKKWESKETEKFKFKSRVEIARWCLLAQISTSSLWSSNTPYLQSISFKVGLKSAHQCTSWWNVSPRKSPRPSHHGYHALARVR